MSLGNRSKLPWWRSKYVLWAFLMLPGLLFTVGLLRGKMTYESLMHSTGEFSGRFLLFSLIATPMVLLLPKYSFPKWLVRNRRYFGVAAFAYGLYHAVAYLIEIPGQEVADDFLKISMLTAWISLIIWIPMAMTSTDGMVKRLKTGWKKIHRWGYLAALCAYLHWAFMHYHWKAALVHAAPIIILQGYRWIVVSLGKK